MKIEAMDPSFQDFEFLDLSDINDAERSHIQNVLCNTSDPSVKYPELPWVEPVYDDEEEEEAEGSERACSPRTSTLNPEVPPYPPSTHIPVTMYQMMPSVYVNNVTANVSVHHPYVGYHQLYHQDQPPPPPQQQQQPQQRPGSNRRPNKGNPKSRDYRNNEQEAPSSPIPQQYPGSFIPMHAYNPYYGGPAPGHMQSAQHATGTPIYLPSHVSMYPPAEMGYPYHPPMYSPVSPAVYANEVPIKDPNHYHPDKMQTYDYNNQNSVKEQYVNEPANQTYIQSGYNNSNIVKDAVPSVYQDRGTTHYTPSNSTETVITHYANKSYGENSSDVSNEENEPNMLNIVKVVPKAGVNALNENNYKDNLLTNAPKSSVSPVGGKTSDFKMNIAMENKKVDIGKFSPPEAKVKIAGAVKYVGDVIVSELKTDAQIFRPANRNKLVFETKKETTVASAVIEEIKTPIVPEVIEPVVVAKETVEIKQTDVVNEIAAKLVIDTVEPKPIETISTPVVEEAKVSPVVEPASLTLAPEPANVAAAAPAGKSWASLFRKNAGPAEADPNAQKRIARVEPFKSEDGAGEAAQLAGDGQRVQRQFDDPQLYRLGESLCKYELDHKAISLQPRGLTNRSNWCYVNSTLQALLACPPFYNLMKSLPPPKKSHTSSTPILDSIVEFVNEFVPLASVPRVRKERNHRKDDGTIDVQSGTAFEPAYIYKMLNNIRSDTFKVEGRQEDAEEFLSCLLNALNDEMLEVIKLVQDGSATELPVANGDHAAGQSQDESGSDSEWHIMGPKKKGVVTRRSDFGRTPVSDIFRGHLRSRVQRAGDQSTDNIQPFFTLQLDIEKAQSVKEALELLVGKDQLEGVTCTKTNQEVEAWQQVTLEDLPLVLVLHLKWFDYKVDGCTKIVKSVEFPIELKVEPKLMSSTKKYGIKAKQYKLFAVVYHDGKEATKGHYVTDAYHVGYGGWVRYDDSNVRAVQESQVLHPRTPRVPYLLYYRRCDTIGNQTPVR